MTDFVELHLTPGTLAELGLPDIGYPVPRAEVEQGGDKLHLAAMLYGLQWKSAGAGSDWAALEPALARLADLMTPDADDPVVTAAGDDWELAIGGVALAGEDRDRRLVTIQRGPHLVAAIRPLPSGQLRVAAYRPLDGRSAGLLIGLARLPHPEYGVNMRKNNWEYALDAAGHGNAGASGPADAYLSIWEKGLGMGRDGTERPEWRAQAGLAPLRAAAVAAQLGAWYTFSDEA